MARALLLKRPSPFAYPGGLPGFDPNHDVAGSVYFSGVGVNGNFVNLLNGQAGTIVNGTGAPAAALNGAIGPVVHFPTASGTGYIKWTGNKAGADTVVTIAAIITFDAFTTTQGIFHNDNAAHGTGLRCSATGALAYLYGSGAGTATSTITLTANVPYFVIASSNGTTVNFLAVRLDTGAVRTQTGVSIVGTPTASNGIYALGTFGALNQEMVGNIAAIMYSGQHLSSAVMRRWAQDPWSFWYPRTIDLTQMLKAPSGGGAAFNQTVTVTCASTVSLTNSVGKSVAATCASAITATRSTAHSVAATCASAVTATRSTAKSLAVTCSGAVSVIKSVAKRVTVACASSVTLSAIRVFLVTISVNCTSSVAAIRKAVGKGVTVQVAGSVTMSRAVAKGIAVTCSGAVSLVKAVAKRVTVACSSFISIVAQLLGLSNQLRGITVTIKTAAVTSTIETAAIDVEITG